MASKRRQWVWAKNSLSVAHPSGRGVQRITRGDTWFADDPVVEAHPDVFSDQPTEPKSSDRRGRRIEQATAAPGESR